MNIGKGFATPTGSGRAPTQRAQSRIERERGPHPPVVFVRAHSKEVTGAIFVRADSKGVTGNVSVPLIVARGKRADSSRRA